MVHGKNRIMNRIIKRISSFVLALCAAFSSVTFTYAEGTKAASLTKANTVTETEKTERIPVSKDTIPEGLDVRSLIADGFTTRIKSAEQSLGEVIFENEEGIRSLYIFDEDVKFRDESGAVKDKSNKAVRKNNTFVSESNDIEVVLPLSIMGGVTLKDDGLNINMRPVSALHTTRFNSAGQIKDEKSVLYQDVFDEYTDVKYTFTYSGVKEDIILEKYNGVSSFNYEVSTGGLSLNEEKGALVLRDDNGEAKAVIGEIVVFSADNKNNTFGEYTIKEKVKNSLYTVTINVDKEYLTSPDTTYPVTIDPTVGTVSTSSNIQDMQVFKGTNGTGTTETSAGLSGVSRVGWTDWGACRTLMKLNKSVLSSNHIVNSWQVALAKVQLRDLMCQSVTTPITCSQFKGNSWSESNTKTWSALNMDAATTPVSTANVTYSNGATTHEWTITSLVKNWVDEMWQEKPEEATVEDIYSNYSKGIVFKTASASHESSSLNAQYMKTFSSMQGNPSYKPVINIWYRFIGCKGVRTVEDEYMSSVKCQAYAFFLNDDLGFFDSQDYFGGYSTKKYLANNNDIDSALTYTKGKLEKWMDDNVEDGIWESWRQVIDTDNAPSYLQPLYDDEWIICMRVGIERTLNTPSTEPKIFDYHFWYRANNGIWYHKWGETQPGKAWKGENPSTTTDVAGWQYNLTHKFYTSDTIYYAVKQ